MPAEMKTIRKHGLGANIMEISSREKTHVAIRANGHKSWSFNIAVVGMNDASAAEGMRNRFCDLEFHGVIIT